MHVICAVKSRMNICSFCSHPRYSLAKVYHCRNTKQGHRRIFSSGTFKRWRPHDSNSTIALWGRSPIVCKSATNVIFRCWIAGWVRATFQGKPQCTNLQKLKLRGVRKRDSRRKTVTIKNTITNMVRIRIIMIARGATSPETDYKTQSIQMIEPPEQT